MISEYVCVGIIIRVIIELCEIPHQKACHYLTQQLKSWMSPTNGISFILFVSELPINMPPKRKHENDIESSSGAPERIRIVADENQNEETKVMCKICSQVQEFSW